MGETNATHSMQRSGIDNGRGAHFAVDIFIVAHKSNGVPCALSNIDGNLNGDEGKTGRTQSADSEETIAICTGKSSSVKWV